MLSPEKRNIVDEFIYQKCHMNTACFEFWHYQNLFLPTRAVAPFLVWRWGYESNWRHPSLFLVVSLLRNCTQIHNGTIVAHWLASHSRRIQPFPPFLDRETNETKPGIDRYLMFIATSVNLLGSKNAILYGMDIGTIRIRYRFLNQVRRPLEFFTVAD